MPTDEKFSVELRPSRDSDLDFVLRLERDPANSPYVGRWSRTEHRAAISAPDREHLIIEADLQPVGYLIALDLRSSSCGVHIKRMVVSEKGRGIGRTALRGYTRRIFERSDAPFVWLDVLPDNLRAQAAYRAAGFHEHALPDDAAAEWARAVGGYDEGSLIMVCSAPREPGKNAS